MTTITEIGGPSSLGGGDRRLGIGVAPWGAVPPCPALFPARPQGPSADQVAAARANLQAWVDLLG